MFSWDFGFGPLQDDFWRWLFLMTRIGAALLAAPLFGGVNVPFQIRVITAGAIALLVAGWTDVQPPASIFSAYGMLAVGGEILVGTALGFVLQFAFAAPIIAAELIGGGMGLGMAATIDPQNGAHSPAIGQYFTVVLTLVFFSLGCHLQWIALVVKSYSVFPPGHTWLAPDRIWEIVSYGTTLFATALAMALPVTLMLLLIMVMAGVLSRSAPALNLFSLGLPAAIAAGFAALLATAPMLTDRVTQLSAEAITASARVIGG
jgi:flagellar biosynthetic protein FliR